MDQVKTGKFIAKCRKEKGLTQAQLAEIVGVSDRAVSKWETGRSMPDSSIMLDVCEAIGINVNELLSGERIVMDNYKNIAEQRLIDLRHSEEEHNKALLRLEVVIGYISTITFLVCIFAASFAVTSTLWRVILIAFGVIVFVVGMYFSISIERDAGFYECKACGHRYMPTTAQVALSRHIGRSRWLRCPMCGKVTLQRKVLTKEKSIKN